MIAASSSRGPLLALFALVISLSLSESSAKDNFSRPFEAMSDEKIGRFLALNPSLSVQLGDMHFIRYMHEHERVIQGFIVPLLFDQRVTLLVCRFHSVISGGFLDPFLDRFIDTIDETPFFSFLFQLIVAPSYPLYQTFRQIESQSSLDETLQFVFVLLSLIESLRFAAFILNLYVSKKTSGATFWMCITDRDAGAWRAPVFSFVGVSSAAVLSFHILWNPFFFQYIPMIFTMGVSGYLGFVFKQATSNIFVGCLPPIICHAIAYFFIGAEAFMPRSVSRVPFQIFTNCVLLALPFWYILQMCRSMKLFVKNIGWLFRLWQRIIPPPPPPPIPIPVPVPVADYRLIPLDEINFDKARVLGKGGCGTVILAKYFCSKVAVKFVNPKKNGSAPDPNSIQGLIEEVESSCDVFLHVCAKISQYHA